MPTWVFGAGGVLQQAPSGWGPAEQWLLAPRLCDLIVDAIEPSARTASGSFGLFPGCWIVPLQQHDVDGTPRVVVVMMLSSDALKAREFAGICKKSSIDHAIASTALKPLARYTSADISRLTSTLQWMHDDLQRMVSDAVAIESFSRELVETYEHISLLYRLSCLVNELSEPSDFVELACHELHRTLDFEWVVAKFIPTTPSGEVLAPRFFCSGDLPCERRRLERLAAQLADTLEPGGQPVLLHRNDSEIGALIASEAIADSVICQQRVTGVLMAGNKSGSDPEISSIDTQMLHAATEYLGSFIHSAGSYHEQRTLFSGTIRAFTSTIDAKDRYTRGHSERVAHLAAQLAEEAGLSKEIIVRVRLAGLLHDVGKIGIPESVLTKSGKLTDDEYEIIKRHPVIGFTILRDIRPLQDVLPGVLFHHERWDGRGYPQGLAGEAIPILGRILAVADMFDAMSSDRAYRAALPRAQILGEIRKQAGSQLDPELAAAFLELDLDEYDRMIAHHLARENEAA